MTRTITLHQSQLSDFLICPERFRRKHVVGDVVDGPTDSTAIGTALHAYAEARIDGDAAGYAFDAAAEAWQTERDAPGFRFVKVKTEKTCLLQIRHCCAMWEQEVFRQLGEPVYLESTFSLPLLEHDDIRVVMEGTIDFADWHIKDWKTTTDPRRFTTGWGNLGHEKQKSDIQSTVYCWAASRLGDIEDPHTFEFVAVNKTRPETYYLLVTRTEADFAWLRRLAWNVARLMVERPDSEWPLNNTSALCSEKFCPAWTTCIGGHFSIPEAVA